MGNTWSVLVTGPTGAGKSCLGRRIFNGQPPPNNLASSNGPETYEGIIAAGKAKEKKIMMHVVEGSGMNGLEDVWFQKLGKAYAIIFMVDGRKTMGNKAYWDGAHDALVTLVRNEKTYEKAVILILVNYFDNAVSDPHVQSVAQNLLRISAGELDKHMQRSKRQYACFGIRTGGSGYGIATAMEWLAEKMQ